MISGSALPHVRFASKIFGREQLAASFPCEALQGMQFLRKKIYSGKNGSVIDPVLQERLPDHLQNILWGNWSLDCQYFYEPYAPPTASITL
jgi:hypothetical protein